jgi:hypothetical protein
MSDIKHHSRRFLNRMIQAEKATTRKEAKKIIRKASKHQKKLVKLKNAMRKFFCR